MRIRFIWQENQTESLTKCRSHWILKRERGENMSSPHDELCPPPTEDDDLTLPRASINKMIKELVSAFDAITLTVNERDANNSFDCRFHRYEWRTRAEN